MNTQIKENTNHNRSIFVILLAVEVVLAFSTLGYIVIPPLSLTFVHIPVLICALLFGPAEGAISGLVFGLTSMWKASVTATAYADIIFSPFISGHPVRSVLLSIVTRMAFGAVAGWLFSYAKKALNMEKTSTSKNPTHFSWLQTAAVMLTAIVATMIHSLFVYSAMQLLFPDAGAKAVDTFLTFTEPQRFLSYLLTAVIIGGVFQIACSRQTNTVFHKLNMWKGGEGLKALLLFLLFCIMGSLLDHFRGRLLSLFQENAHFIPNEIMKPMNQLFFQLFAGLFSLTIIFLIIYSIMRTHLDQIIYRSKRDLMTGLYNRAAVISQIESCLPSDSGYIIIVDVDDFKKINDTYGHPTGDDVLIQIAELLKKLPETGYIAGRLGGDEFCLFAKDHFTHTEIEEMIAVLQSGIRQAGIDCRLQTPLTCSMGIAKAERGNEFSQLYKEADHALYEAKRMGKGCHIFFDSI